jgi:hypothetical protein
MGGRPPLDMHPRALPESLSCRRCLERRSHGFEIIQLLTQCITERSAADAYLFISPECHRDRL